jgi:hypothetical protein
VFNDIERRLRFSSDTHPIRQRHWTVWCPNIDLKIPGFRVSRAELPLPSLTVLGDAGGRLLPAQTGATEVYNDFVANGIGTNDRYWVTAICCYHTPLSKRLMSKRSSAIIISLGCKP